MAARIKKLIDSGYWVFQFTSLGLAAFLLAGIINSIIAGRLSGLPVPGPELDPPDRVRNDQSPDNHVIVERNLFGSAMAKDDPPEPPGSALRVALSPLRASLIGTVVADDPAFSMGLILDRTSSETGIYRIGDTLLGQATVVEVLGQRIYVQRDGQLEYLTLGEEESPPSLENRAPVSASPEPDLGGIQKTGPRRWRIDRNELERITGNLSAVAVNVRIVPKIVEGEMQGFKLYSMRPGSIFSRLGFQNGDVIERVNGYRLTSPEIVLELYKKLSQARRVEIEVVRGKTPVTHEYQIE